MTENHNYFHTEQNHTTLLQYYCKAEPLGFNQGNHHSNPAHTNHTRKNTKQTQKTKIEQHKIQILFRI